VRQLRLLAWFLFGVALAVVPMLVFAETIPATATPRVAATYWGGGGGVGPRYGTVPLAVCAAIWGSAERADLSAGKYYCLVNGAFMNGYPLSQVSACIDTDPGPGVSCTGNVYSCPATGGWTLSGTSCTRPDQCPAGFSKINDTGNCVSDVCPDGSARAANGLCRGAACNGSGGLPQPGGLATIESSCSDQGCASTWWKYEGGSSLRTTGGECNPSVPPANNDCPAGTTTQTSGATTKCYPTSNSCVGSGQCSGTVNGVTICFACPANTTTKTGGGSSSGGTTVTPPGGSPVTTPAPNVDVKETVSPTGSGGAPVVTRTTTTTYPDGTTSQEVKVQSEGIYCEQNPNSPTCKAVDDPCKDGSDLVSCSKLGTPAAEGDLNSSSNSVSSITPVSVAANATCPADIPLPKGMRFEWTPVCQWAEGLRPVVLALAWLAAGLIVLGAKEA